MKIYVYSVEAVVAERHKRVKVEAMVVGLVPTRGNEIFNIFFCSLVPKHSFDTPLDTQFLKMVN